LIALKENHEKIKWLVSITTILFIGSLIFFSIKIISEIKEREIAAIKRYANFLQYISSNKESPYYYIDEIIIDNNNIPVIVTDENYHIIDHKNVIYSDNESKKSQILKKTLSSMKNGYEPIEVLIYNSNNVVINKQFVFYKNSEILDLIILAPYYLSLFILIILISIYLIFYYSNASEKDRLWTGLAKETAHQLGTPLSSLIAWKEYIKSKNIWELNDFQGKWLVMYFYPKDFTAGCTLEAKGFSELKKDFSKYNAEIVGISADNQDSHESFCSEKSINYTLLSDPDGIISKKYGSWIPPFSDRNTFLISPKGEISYRWISVLPINHAKEVLNVLKKKI